MLNSRYNGESRGVRSLLTLYRVPKASHSRALEARLRRSRRSRRGKRLHSKQQNQRLSHKLTRTGHRKYSSNTLRLSSTSNSSRGRHLRSRQNARIVTSKIRRTRDRANSANSAKSSRRNRIVRHYNKSSKSLNGVTIFNNHASATSRQHRLRRHMRYNRTRRQRRRGRRPQYQRVMPRRHSQLNRHFQHLNVSTHKTRSISHRLLRRRQGTRYSRRHIREANTRAQGRRRIRRRTGRAHSRRANSRHRTRYGHLTNRSHTRSMHHMHANRRRFTVHIISRTRLPRNRQRARHHRGRCQTVKRSHSRLQCGRIRPSVSFCSLKQVQAQTLRTPNPHVHLRVQVKLSKTVKLPRNVSRTVVTSPTSVQHLMSIIIFTVSNSHTFENVRHSTINNTFSIVRNRALHLLSRFLPRMRKNMNKFRKVQNQPIVPMPNFRVLRRNPIFLITRDLMMIPYNRLTFSIIQTSQNSLFFHSKRKSSKGAIHLRAQHLMFLRRHSIKVAIRHISRNINAQNLRLVSSNTRIHNARQHMFLSSSLRTVIFHVNIRSTIHNLKRRVVKSRGRRPSTTLLLRVIRDKGSLLIQHHAHVRSVKTNLRTFVLRQVRRRHIIYFRRQLRNFTKHKDPSTRRHHRTILFGRNLNFLHRRHQFKLTILLRSFRFLTRRAALNISLVSHRVRQVKRNLLKRNRNTTRQIRRASNSTLYTNVRATLHKDTKTVKFRNLSINRNTPPTATTNRNSRHNRRRDNHSQSRRSRLHRAPIPLSRSTRTIAYPFVPAPFTHHITLIFPGHLACSIFIGRAPGALYSRKGAQR